MPVQSSYIWNHGVKMWIYGYAKYKRSLIVEGVSERWWRCCQTSFSLLLFLPNKNWRKGGGTSLWTLMDQVFDELPKVQDWVRCRPPSVAHPPLGLIGANFLRAWCCWTLPSCRAEDFMDFELEQVSDLLKCKFWRGRGGKRKRHRRKDNTLR